MAESAVAGNNSISETFADNAGVEAAYLAYTALRQPDRQEGAGQCTADQAFFPGSCYIFCDAERSSSEAGINLPHTFRCNKPCISTQEFADAFHCRDNSPMFPPRRCYIHDLQQIKH
ncbi:neprilysin-1-like [Amblyomma americanum]